MKENKRVYGYPKEAKKRMASKIWDSFRKSEEGKKFYKDLELEFLNYVLLGKSTYFIDESVLKDLIEFEEFPIEERECLDVIHMYEDSTVRTRCMTMDEIVEKYSEHFTEEEKQKILRLKNKNK